MKFKTTTFFILFYASCSFAQTNLGLGIDLFQSTLVGTARGETNHSGFSGLPHTSEKTIGRSFDVIFQSKLNQKLEIEYGVGYFHENEKIHIDGIRIITGVAYPKTLDIQLHYLEFPVQLNYILHQYNQTGLVLGMIGLSPKLLIGEKDNYQDIIFQEIYLSYPYRRLSLNAHVAIAFRQFLPNGKVQLFQSWSGIGS